MNDFTKEELEYIKWCVREAHKHPDLRGSGATWSCSCEPILKKIYAIIDNYCEHDDNYDHLNDKHIVQYAGYLIEELPRWRDIEKVLFSNPEIDDIFIEIYKKGYQDRKTRGGTRCNE